VGGGGTSSPTQNIAVIPNADTYVAYSASAVPIQIILSGGIGDQLHHRYLIGQLCQATVSSPLLVSSRNWTVTGGLPFAGFSPSPQIGHVVPAPPQQTTSVFNTYFASASASVSVACAIHIQVPAPQLPAGGLDATLSINFQTEIPTVTSKIRHVFPDPQSSVYLTPTYDPVNQTVPEAIVFARPVTNGVGIQFDCGVATPTDYLPAGAVDWWNETLAGGWNILQVAHSGRHRTLSSGAQQTMKCHGFTTGLDSTLPYEPAGTGPHFYKADGSVGTNPDVTDTTIQSFNDPFEDPPVNPVYFKIDESFDTYLMYMPPGTNSVYVPLHMWTWFWKGSAAHQTGDFPHWIPGQDPMAAGVSNEIDFPAFPAWDTLFNTDAGWVTDP
jgi:hypothetical protein